MCVGRGKVFLWVAMVFGLMLLVESRKNRGKSLDFEKLVNKLWELDANRFEINRDLVLNLQEFVSNPLEDKAPQPLFTFVNGTRLYNTPTFRAFIKLMGFYEPNILVIETSNPEKVQSQMAFLDAILATPVMAEVRRYLEERKLASSVDEEFKEMLGHIWFTGIERKKRLSSSAFEHVFLGEGRGARVLGFHYWLPLYLHEQEDDLNYFGFYGKKGSIQKVSLRFGSLYEATCNMTNILFITEIIISIGNNDFRISS
ncbi:polyu specific endoribonuclease [Echinococcus multilocularis]|uniref:Uridylate-specific endoribonuclease n=1 Tax=Echinococcus multilocularis TaxID=6211 RepID=A0A068YG99_ECHMU|nr:polyu specific endoribonuclease [Echinococcus multilocularis]